MIDLKESSAESVFRFFGEISKIPRGSGNTKNIADYLVRFANERGLSVHRDKADNVIIKKPATPGFENSTTLILQGHTDMVLGSADGNTDNFLSGVKIIVDGDFIRADGTTLGADNGIAVAYMLALLDSEDIHHPALEAVFTSDEEIGLIGAEALDGSMLSGKVMINLDSDEEGVFTAGCAGGRRIDITLPIEYKTEKNKKYKFILDGLLGGHSGVMINEGRTNAIKRICEYLSAFGNINLVNLSGGVADNAIPASAEAEFVSSLSIKELSDIVKKVKDALPEAAERENVALIESEAGDKIITRESTENLLALISAIPFGALKMSDDIPDMVETSANIGIINVTNGNANVSISIRSSKDEEKEALANKIKDTAKSCYASASEHSDYPGWEYKKESRLRDTLCKTYRNMYGKEAAVITIHAGLECSIFAKKVEGLDCISLGPTALDIHTPDERLSISSTERVWDFLKETLKNI